MLTSMDMFVGVGGGHLEHAEGCKTDGSHSHCNDVDLKYIYIYKYGFS